MPPARHLEEGAITLESGNWARSQLVKQAVKHASRNILYSFFWWQPTLTGDGEPHFCRQRQ